MWDRFVEFGIQALGAIVVLVVGYLAAKLALIASTPTIDEVFDRIEHRNKGRLSGEDAIAALESERARR